MLVVQDKDPAPLSAAEFQIMLSLADGERHGYSIIKEIEDATGGRMQIGFTTLYRHLKRMRTDGWITEIAGGDPRRRSYKLTRRGRTVAEAEASRLTEALRLAKARRLIPAHVRL
jgi:DNA-binding PadR family transcriptional regulator